MVSNVTRIHLGTVIRGQSQVDARTVPSLKRQHKEKPHLFSRGQTTCRFAVWGPFQSSLRLQSVCSKYIHIQTQHACT